MQFSFVTSQNLLLFSFCKTPKKTTLSVFQSFFLGKLSKSRSSKLNISRTAWPILTILVSLCRILNGLLAEINLFWRCSSPLKTDDSVKVEILKDYLSSIGKTLAQNFTEQKEHQDS